MRYRPLSRRITLAFIAVVAIVSCLFSVGIIVAVRYVEMQLITDNLHGDLAIAMADLNAGRDIDLEPGTRFYYETEQTAAIDNLDISETELSAKPKKKSGGKK